MSKGDYISLIKENGQLVFTPGGTSMNPILRHHQCPVIIKAADDRTKLKKYDIPFYRRDNGQFVLHRIIGKNKDGFICCGDGQTAPEYGVREDMIFGILVGYYKGDKYIDVKRNTRYKIYSRFWVAIRPIRRVFAKLRSTVAGFGKKRED